MTIIRTVLPKGEHAIAVGQGRHLQEYWPGVFSTYYGDILARPAAVASDGSYINWDLQADDFGPGDASDLEEVHRRLDEANRRADAALQVLAEIRRRGARGGQYVCSLQEYNAIRGLFPPIQESRIQQTGQVQIPAGDLETRQSVLEKLRPSLNLDCVDQRQVERTAAGPRVIGWGLVSFTPISIERPPLPPPAPPPPAAAGLAAGEPAEGPPELAAAAAPPQRRRWWPWLLLLLPLLLLLGLLIWLFWPQGAGLPYEKYPSLVGTEQYVLVWYPGMKDRNTTDILPGGPATLTIQSVPDAGVPITVDPAGTRVGGEAAGPVTWAYDPGTEVSLAAPQDHDGKRFVRWMKDGKEFAKDPQVKVPADGHHTFVADYGAGACVLSVQSDPDKGVPITVSPSDTDGQGDGATHFKRAYKSGTSVSLKAPPQSNDKEFVRWLQDGAFLTDKPEATVAMDADHSLKAVYGEKGLKITVKPVVGLAEGFRIESEVGGLPFGERPKWDVVPADIFTRHYEEGRSVGVDLYWPYEERQKVTGKLLEDMRFEITPGTGDILYHVTTNGAKDYYWIGAELYDLPSRYGLRMEILEPKAGERPKDWRLLDQPITLARGNEKKQFLIFLMPASALSAKQEITVRIRLSNNLGEQWEHPIRLVRKVD